MKSSFFLENGFFNRAGVMEKFHKESHFAPIEADGFVVSFGVEEPEALSRFFDEFGFVVVRDVLTDAECEQTMVEFFNQFVRGKDASDEDLEAFYRALPFGEFGIIGAGPNLTSLSQLRNRQNALVHAG